MAFARMVFLALVAVGLAFRLWALPLWGTFDVEVQKAWSARAASVGLADIYGPSDTEILRQAAGRPGSTLGALMTMPFPRTEFEWGTARYFVDYPPGSVLVLWAAGEAYRLAAPEMPNRSLFNVAVNLAPLAGSMAILLLLSRSAPEHVGWRRGLFFWLNPAMLLAAPVLGYQDTVFGAFALAAVLALVNRRPVAATALTVAAGLIKPQGSLLLPALAVVLWRESRPATWARAAAAGSAVAALILMPWWSQGHLLSALDGCRRPLAQIALAPLGLNVWWVAGYVMEWSKHGSWPLAPIVTIDAFRGWAGFDPRLVSRVLLGVATLANVAWLAASPHDERWRIPLAVIVQVHAYALLGTRVHENHTFLAVILAPLLVGAWPRAEALHAATSGFLFASLFLAAGFGRRITRLRFLQEVRASWGLDLSVIVAFLHVVLVAALFVGLARTWTSRVAPPEAR